MRGLPLPAPTEDHEAGSKEDEQQEQEGRRASECARKEALRSDFKAVVERRILVEYPCAFSLVIQPFAERDTVLVDLYVDVALAGRAGQAAARSVRYGRYGGVRASGACAPGGPGLVCARLGPDFDQAAAFGFAPRFVAGSVRASARASARVTAAARAAARSARGARGSACVVSVRAAAGTGIRAGFGIVLAARLGIGFVARLGIVVLVAVLVARLIACLAARFGAGAGVGARRYCSAGARFAARVGRIGAVVNLPAVGMELSTLV
jgi:hypothetical protein